MKRVLVAGATGTLGRLVVAELHRRGFPVDALCRTAERAAGLPARIVVADALHAEELRGAMRGIDVVFSCLGQTLSPNLSVRGPGYMGVDWPANANLLEAAEDARVRRFVYVSALHAHRFPGVAYLAAHAKVADALKASPLEYGIIEPTSLFSQCRMAGAIQFGDGSAKSNPIDDSELAALCVDLIDGAGSMVVQAGGPDILTRRDILQCTRRMPLWMLDALGMVRPFGPRLADLAAYHRLLSTHDFVAPALGRRTLLTGAQEFFS